MDAPSRSVPDRRVDAILLDAAREVYVPSAAAETEKIPVDRRCSSCGVDRPSCDLAGCIRKETGDA